MSTEDIWSLLGNGLGLLGGLLLCWSTIRVNNLLREAWELRNMLTSSQSGLEKQTFNAMQKMAQQQANSWNKWDERRLYGGALGLLLSFACSLVSSLLKANVL